MRRDQSYTILLLALRSKLVKLLIPSHCIELTGEVQQVLRLAQQQGFAIESVVLGVSPTPSLQLVADTTSSFSCDLFAHIDQPQGENERVIRYFSSTSNPEVDENSITIGGHVQGKVADFWQQEGVHYGLTSVSVLEPPQAWRHLAWLMAALSLDFPLHDALTLARAALKVSRETWPTEYQDFPVPYLFSANAFRTLAFPPLQKESLGLYPVVDDVGWVDRLLQLGVKTVQLRIKHPQQLDLEPQIIQAIALGRQYQAQVFINDYWQLAIKHGAFGVHLGQEDLQTADIQALAKADIRLGLSSHGYFELLYAQQFQPSYIALGHIFPTTTKQMPSKPQGLVRLALYQQLLNTLPYGEKQGMPSVAIGGIDLSNIQSVVNCGVTSVAVVRAVTQAADTQLAVQQLQASFSQNLNLTLGAVSHPSEVTDVIG